MRENEKNTMLYWFTPLHMSSLKYCSDCNSSLASISVVAFVSILSNSISGATLKYGYLLLQNVYNHPATSNLFGLPSAHNGLCFTYDIEGIFFFFFFSEIQAISCPKHIFVVASIKFILGYKSNSVSEGASDPHSNRQW
jgi:hypothetical protein